MSIAPPPPRPPGPQQSSQPSNSTSSSQSQQLYEWFSIDPRDEKEIAYYPAVADKIETAFQNAETDITLLFDQRPYKIVFAEMLQYNSTGGSRKVLRKSRTSLTSNDWKLMCGNFRSKNGCTFGSNCRFLHVVPQTELVVKKASAEIPVCRYFSKDGNCPNGENCRFRHEQQSNNKSSLPSSPAAAATGGTTVIKSPFVAIAAASGNQQQQELCHHFNSEAGCSRGNACRFAHVSSSNKSQPSSPKTPTIQAPNHLALLFDTCALHDLEKDTQYLDFLLRNNNIVIFPYAVVDELDQQNHVKGSGNDKQRELKSNSMTYRDWVLFQKSKNNNPNLILQSRTQRSTHVSVNEMINDNHILGAAMFYGQYDGKDFVKSEFAKTPGHDASKLKFVLVTNDKFMQVKCLAENLRVVDTKTLQHGNLMDLIKNDKCL